MPRVRLATFAAAVGTIAALASAAPREPATRPAANKPAPAKTWDDAAIRAEIERAATADPAVARDACKKLLTTGRLDQRPLAVAAFLKFADAKAIAALARELRADQYRDERRLLVRALGRAAAAEALPLLEGFITDGDALVRAATASALADHGRPLAVGLFVPRLPSMTDHWDVGGSGDDHIFGVAVYGAIKSLTGQPPENAAAVKVWWDANRPTLTVATSRPATSPRDVQAGPINGRMATDAFDIRFQPRGLDRAVADRFRLNGAGGWEPLVRELESMAADTRRRAAPLFGGTLHLPLTRIDFANGQTFGGTGGVAGRAGSATRCRITFNLDEIGDVGQWQRLISHEYVHVVHAAQFAKTPRWLAEGLATSLSESPERTGWSASRVHALGLAGQVERGAVDQAIGWDTGGVSGAAENARYQLSHLLVDYLRFGPFGEPDVRLFCLLGELDRGRPARASLERVYGMPIAELNRGLSAWLVERDVEK